MIAVPSKIIILGEHAVCYGSRAIAVPFGKGVSVEVRSNNNFSIKYTADLRHPELIEEMITKICFYLDQKKDNLLITLKFFQPIGVGLGISAALSCALTKGLSRYFGKNLSLSAQAEIVLECEKIFHKHPSGIDHYTILYNKPVLFQNNQDIRLLGNLSNFIQYCEFQNTGIPDEQTAEMVELVAQGYKYKPFKYQSIFDKIDDLVGQFLNIKNITEYPAIINQNGLLLEELGVVSREVCVLSKKLRAQGWAVKICGAGGIRGTGSGMILKIKQI